METNSSRQANVSGRWRTRTKLGSSSNSDFATPIHSLGADILCAIFALLDHFDLIRCSIVCKSWKSVILTSALMRDLYYRRNPHAGSSEEMSPPLDTSMRVYLGELAMEQHRLALTSSSPEVHQWRGHSDRINLCRMKRGLILTGAGDKVLRLWSAESYKCLDEFSWSNKSVLVDCDFDENKIVGLSGSQISIWRHNRQRSIFQSREGIFTRALCMRYMDPEAVIGCDDGRARIFDLYSGSCSRIIRMHGGPITSLALSEENLIFGGSNFGTIAVADLSTGERLAVLNSFVRTTGMKNLCLNLHSYLLFAGSTSGYAHCWDLRTLRPLWEMRVSPTVIYATHHLSNDTSALAVGGLDGVLRILNQNTGEILSSFVMDSGSGVQASNCNSEAVEKRNVTALSKYACLDQIARSSRPSITSLAVGMKKMVTTHNEKYIRMWKFHE